MGSFPKSGFKTQRSLVVDRKSYEYFALSALPKAVGEINRLPVSLKVLLECALRLTETEDAPGSPTEGFSRWLQSGRCGDQVSFRPSRILMNDFTGVPALVDLAAMRDGMAALGGDPKRINPTLPVDLIIDHSVIVDHAQTADATERNEAVEFQRNRERFEFLRWGQASFDNFRVFPPGAGICHQVNLEYLAQCVWTAERSGATYVYPDLVCGTDSHTPMIGGLGVLGWGIGGIEAEAAMLGRSLAMLIPDVIGVRVTGQLPEGINSTDLVLTVTQILRRKGVVGKFVEFFGPGLDALPLAYRAAISNMAPEYGATCGFFPVDRQSLDYLRLTGRDSARIALAEAYLQTQGMFRDSDTPDPLFTETLELDLSTIQRSVAGPRRPQDRVALQEAASGLTTELATTYKVGAATSAPAANPVQNKTGDNDTQDITHGKVVIAAITSCTNTSNPALLIAAGLLARKARAKGLNRKWWVKTSLAPGSRAVTDYLEKSGLQADLDAIGFHTVGYGCTTCIGNSGPLLDGVAGMIDAQKLVAVAVLSGNRNFEGRIHPKVRASYLASPPLVVAYALLGSMTTDITTQPLGAGADGKPVYLKEIWPSDREIDDTMAACLTADQYKSRYGSILSGTKDWEAISVNDHPVYAWDERSTYVRRPHYFEDMARTPAATTDIVGARILAVLPDSISTDHISPAGSIEKLSPAGRYLSERDTEEEDFNSYGARRGNHEVMIRGAFANIRLKNEMVEGEGGKTIHIPSGVQMTMYEAAERYHSEATPLVIVAGKEYGCGPSRDWAAKATLSLGVKAVICEGFERIHRSNLIGMGILPLMFRDGDTRQTLGIRGTEIIDVLGVESFGPRSELMLAIHRADGSVDGVSVVCRIDTDEELQDYRHGGTLQHLLRRFTADDAAA